MLGSSRCSSTQSAVTRAVSRLMCVSSSSWGLWSWSGSGVGVDGALVAGDGGPTYQQVHLAAQAEPEDRVEQCRHEREAGGHRAEQGQPRQVADQATTVKTSPTPWAKRGGCGSSRCVGAARRGRTKIRKAYDAGVRVTPRTTATANSTAWIAEQDDACGVRCRQQGERQHDAGEHGVELRSSRIDLHASPVSWAGWAALGRNDAGAGFFPERGRRLRTGDRGRSGRGSDPLRVVWSARSNSRR